MSRVLEDAPLERLLARCGIASYDRYIWFRGCSLKGTVIHVPHRKIAASLERLFLPKLAGYRVVVDTAIKKPSAGLPQPQQSRLLDPED